MSRKVEIDAIELLDCYIAGLDGDWQDYIFVFLRDNCSITMSDFEALALKYFNTKGYGIEDHDHILECGKEFMMLIKKWTVTW